MYLIKGNIIYNGAHLGRAIEMGRFRLTIEKVHTIVYNIVYNGSNK